MSNTCDLMLPLNLGVKVELGSKLVDVLGIISTGLADGVGGWVPSGSGGVDSDGVDGWVISGTGGVPDGLAGKSTGGVDPCAITSTDFRLIELATTSVVDDGGGSPTGSFIWFKG